MGPVEVADDGCDDVFLATWAKRLSCRETGRAFGVSWDYVCKAVTWIVEYGRQHQDLSGITAIGVDEIPHKKGHKFITLVYQSDAGCRRILWIGEGHTPKTLEGFFAWFGKERSASLEFVCSDMWKGFLAVIRRRAQGDVAHLGQILHRRQPQQGC